LKKLILIVAALVMVASGVAAVSAYEAHVVNVTAKVENALMLRYGQTTDNVEPLHVAYGTVFPEEWAKIHFNVELSQSFLATEDEGYVDNVTYELWAERKEIPAEVDTTNMCFDNISGTLYYCWMGEALWVGRGIGAADWPSDLAGDPTGGAVTDNCPDGVTELGAPGDLQLVGPIAANQMAIPFAGPFVLDGGDPVHIIGVGFDVPAFAGYYNEHTDVCPKPSRRDSPTWVIPANDKRHVPGGVDLGIDLKVQVIDIGRNSFP
jgi:hypothetical protein